MNTSDLIKKIDIRKLMEHYKFKHTNDDGTGFIRSACAIHDGDNPTSFVVNKETGLWYCHTGCGGGDVFTLVQKMEKLSFIESVKWISDFYELDVSDIKMDKRAIAHQQELDEWMLHNKRIRAEQPLKVCPIKPVTREIASFRKFKKETLDKFGVAFVEEIDLINKKSEVYTLTNRLYFPIIFDNIYVGFSLRKTREEDIMKWSHQPRDFSVGRILYNYDNVCDADEIIVCEGIIDVLACYEAGLDAVCTFGAHLSKEQYNLLLRTGADITFAFDSDKAGREATSKAANLLKDKATIRTLNFRDGQDPDSIERGELKDAFLSRTKIY